MENNTEAISIEKILEEDNYLVPIYQRNYEWERPQITKLIQDIKDIKTKDEDDSSENENYYLGTLVTFRRGNTYELIDGQQRHTTLNLIKAVIETDSKRFNLKFQARPECDFFLESVMRDKEVLPDNERSANLANGVRIIKDVFKEKGIDEIDSFRNKFLHHTFIFRTELPEKTDLNHYFEIMNNRGEQLEKHEILKAKMMGVINEKYRRTFAKIWDACSDMGNYVWDNFDKNIATKIIEKIKATENKLENYAELFSGLEKEDEKRGISELIHTALPENFSQEDQTKTQRYRSVTDFPTFLLYVLSLSGREKENMSFDDKKLLEVFSLNPDKKFGDAVSAEDFIVNLLYYRCRFDKIIIKNGSIDGNVESSWGIRTYSVKDLQYAGIVDQAFTDIDLEKKIEMLQAMFYFATISNNKKDWLLELLNAKYDDEVEIYRILKGAFTEELQNLDISKLNYDDSSPKHFYYFEYMLWELYYDFIKGDRKFSVPTELKAIADRISNREPYFNYYFRQLNSKEHLLAQNKLNTIDSIPSEAENILNSFGNLCLINTSENSSASNEHPKYKKDKFKNNNSSLKRLIMFNTYDGETWNTEQIERHESEMNMLLDYYQQK